MTAELTTPTNTFLKRDMSRLNLTGAHLREGVPGDDNLCAAAVGLLEMLGASEPEFGVLPPAVTVTDIIDLRWGSEMWWAEVPDDMAEFISEFDQTGDDAALLARMIAAARLGLYQYDLTWYPGPPPEEAG